MSNINPQWRYEVLTEVFGACGIGWKYDVEQIRVDDREGETVLTVIVKLYYKAGDAWSEAIPGIGGSKLVAKEGTPPNVRFYVDDEAFKKALTDALSVAAKMLGIGATVYAGEHGTKYPAGDKQPSGTRRQTGTQEAQPMTQLQSQVITALRVYAKGFDAKQKKALTEQISAITGGIEDPRRVRDEAHLRGILELAKGGNA